MENLIQKIIQIDEDAKTRLRQAEEDKEQILSKAYAEEKRLRQEILLQSEERLRLKEGEEQKKAEEKLLSLENKAQAEIKALEEQYAQKQEGWKQEIFRAVTGGV